MTKKQVKIAWIAGGSLVGLIVIVKIVAARSAAKAAALRTQQLNAASASTSSRAAADLPTSAPLYAPLAPITVVNTDPNDPGNIQISATSAPSNIAPVAIV